MSDKKEAERLDEPRSDAGPASGGSPMRDGAHARGRGSLEKACPVRTAIDVIAGRWKPSILQQLNDAPRRHCELLRSIDGISSQALSMQLRQLMADDVVAKISRDQAVYALTPRGMALATVMDGLSHWGESYLSWRGETGRKAR